jgi:hypothetical protein
MKKNNQKAGEKQSLVMSMAYFLSNASSLDGNKEKISQYSFQNMSKPLSN